MRPGPDLQQHAQERGLRRVMHDHHVQAAVAGPGRRADLHAAAEEPAVRQHHSVPGEIPGRDPGHRFPGPAGLLHPEADRPPAGQRAQRGNRVGGGPADQPGPVGDLAGHRREAEVGAQHGDLLGLPGDAQPEQVKAGLLAVQDRGRGRRRAGRQAELPRQVVAPARGDQRHAAARLGDRAGQRPGQAVAADRDRHLAALRGGRGQLPGVRQARRRLHLVAGAGAVQRRGGRSQGPQRPTAARGRIDHQAQRLIHRSLLRTRPGVPSGAMASQGSAVVGTEVRYLQVHTTTDSRAEAMELARGAVEARLAACAQVTGPIASTYWWEEQVERAEEWQLILKLPTDRYAELAVYLTERHSYDEPEIVATPIITGSPGYLAWIEDETRRS